MSPLEVPWQGPPGGALERAWIASPYESVCHAVPVTDCQGGSIAADCDRRVYGPVDLRRGEDPPGYHERDWPYSPCEPCLVAIGYMPPRTTPWRPIVWTGPDWPNKDPDDEESAPIGREPAPTMIAPRSTAAEPGPGSAYLPGVSAPKPIDPIEDVLDAA